MTLDITQFYQTFFDEADELLADMEQLLLNLDIASPDPEDLNAIFRAAHSIKGGAATFGFTALTQTTHILESLLDRARRNELTLRMDMIDTFLETKDVLGAQLADYRASREPDADAAQAICAKLERLNAEDDTNASEALASASAPSPTPGLGRQLEDSIESMAELSAELDALAAQAATSVAAQRSGAAATAGAVVQVALDVPNAPPQHVVEQVLADAGVVPATGPDAPGDEPHLCVTLINVAANDEELLLEELGNLGTLVGQQRSGNRLKVWLDSDVSPSDITAVCCFVINEDQIEIGRGTAPSADVLAAHAAAAGADEASMATLASQPSASTDAGPTTAPIAGSTPSASASAGSPAAPAAISAGTPSVAASSAVAVQASAPEATVAIAKAQASTKADAQAPGSAPSQPPAAPVSAAPPKARAGAAAAEGSSIRVGVEKVDQLINLVGELVITQAMLAETSTAFDPALHDRLFNGMAQLERNARDLQEAVMSIRMMPMDYVFSRFPRVVRDLAAKLGKEVELVTFGQATELDKSLIERIIDPLTHLVRNSLDHGIETVENRVKAGKDPVGQLVLSAAHHGGNIVIEVSDDGAGLNRERILAKALKNGIAVSDAMTDEEVWNLIFLPGFSTAEQITDVSGRGVGMDVVKRNIQAMGGHVEIASQAGAGSTTRIVLPLTLAILDGMSVKVGEEIFILPLNFVMESLQPSAEDIYTISNGERVVRVRGEYLPLVALHEAFSVEGARTDPTQGIVTIMQTEGRRFAMLIDELVNQHQVVVKNLETNYRKIHGISAATILGDGSVSLIVDVAAFNRETRSQHPAALATH
jgi:two-component system chemotaxis sensor kinase CheA